MTPDNTRELIAEAREWLEDHRYGYQDYPGGPRNEYPGIDLVQHLADALEARQPSEDDREVLAKQLRDIGAVRKVDHDCSCQDCEGAAEWVNAPLSVVLDHFKTNVSDAEPTHLVCAWCPQPARGDAWHNDGKLHPSCGQIDHGQGWVPPYTPRAAVPDAATELRAERDAAVEALKRVRAIHAPLSSLTWGAPDEFLVCEGCNDPDARGFIYWPCPTVAALDGAPEPEGRWEYGAKVYNSGRVVRIEDSPEKVRLGRSAISYANPQWVDDVLVRRRKAGPWLPVEGEKP